MTTLNSSIALNAAFLAEVKECAGTYLGQMHGIRELLASSQLSASELCRSLSEMCDSVSKQFLLEETYGYVQYRGSRARTGCEQAAQAVMEHRFLYAQLVGIAESICNQSYCGFFESKRDAVALEISDCFAKLEAHELMESKLIDSKLGGSFASVVHRDNSPVTVS